MQGPFEPRPPADDPFNALARAGPVTVLSPPTTLIGRERDLASLADLLIREHARLVTLTGPGGVGKTRLALAVVDEVASAFSAGAALAALAPLQDPRLLLHTIALGLGVRESADVSAREALIEHLRDRHVLLVLDNFEHLLAAATEVATMLAACPRLTILATSRAPLRLRGEREYPVTPLSVPDRRQAATAAQVAATAAGQLFAERARDVSPSFSLSEANATAVASICHRLDGLPLALELAAARTRVLAPEDLLRRLDRSLPLLTGGARDLPARQRTMRDAIAWSYNLLPEAAQAHVRRLGVFAGGCTAVAAEDVCGADIDALGLLAENSLLVAEQGPNGEPRCRLLETIREYALERLEASGEAADLRNRHAAHFLAIAEAAAPRLTGAEQATCLDQLDAELGNVRAALGWCIEARSSEGQPCGGADVALRLASTLWQFWEMRHLGEGRQWLQRALAAGEAAPAASRLGALLAAGNLAYRQGDLAAAEGAHRAALELAREVRDGLGQARALNNLATVVGLRDAAAGQALFEESLSLARQLGLTWNTAVTLNNLAHLAHLQGEHSRAMALYEESVALLRQMGDAHSIARSLTNQARVARDMGEPARAATLALEALSQRSELGDQWGLADSFENLGTIAQAQGRAERAARLLGAAEALRERLDTPLPLDTQAAHEQAVSAARAQLGVDRFEAAWSGGRALALADAVAFALIDEERVEASQRAARKEDAAPGRLSPREWEVAQLIARGLTSREIAEQLVITEKTVDTHADHIRTKLNLRSRVEIAAWAVMQERSRVQP